MKIVSTLFLLCYCFTFLVEKSTRVPWFLPVLLFIIFS